MLLLKSSFAQQLYFTKVICADKDSSFFKKQYAYKTTFKDSLQSIKEGKVLFKKLKETGYAAASIDSMVSIFPYTYIYMYVGDRFENIHLLNGNVPDGILADAGLRKLKGGLDFPASGLELVKAKVLQVCENSGYPFAEVSIDSFLMNGKNVSAKIYLVRHDLIRYDTLNLLGKTKAKRIFLKNYLGIRVGKPYNESNVRKITQRINELQFVESIKPNTIEFKNEKATVNLFLKDKKSSQFDLLLGVLPGSSGQKVLITGDVKLHLFSPFGLGEELFLQWQKLQPKTQTLDVRVVYPYLLGLPLGINVQFQLYKRDTSYLDLNGDYGVQYQLLGSNYLKASLKQKITNVLNTDTNYIKANRALPPILDLRTNEFALELFLQKLNYRFNPVSGYVLKASVAAGVRAIKKNNAIINLTDPSDGKSFSYLYDSIGLKTFQMHLSLGIDKYWKIAKRQTIKTSFEGKYFLSPRIFDNEKYRLGGVASLRGFDDQSIYTSYYAMANLEYRFLLSKNSYFYTFFNAAMVEETRNFKNKPFDFPFGFGAGAAFETKIGIFGLSYAMGRQLDNAISFKSGKIHFGYVNYF